VAPVTEPWNLPPGAITDARPAGCEAADVTSSRVRRAAAVCVIVAGSIAWVLFLTEVGRHTRYGTSDNANALLAGQSMLHGNLLLRGWELPPDSYWLIDLPLFGLASVLFGLREVLLHAVPAAVAMAAVAVGAIVAQMDLRPTRRWVAAGVLFILLVIPHNYLVLFVLQGPHHLMTGLYCLIAFALLARSGFGEWRWMLAIVLLAAAAHSDAVAIAVGVVPVAAAGLLDGLRSRRLAALVAPLTAAVGALLGAALLHLLLQVADGYTLRPDPAPYIHAWRQNLRDTPTILGALLGVLSRGGLKGRDLAAHWAGAGLFVAAAAMTLFRSAISLRRPATPPADDPPPVRLRRPGPAWLDDVLLVGCVGGVAVFALLTRPGQQVINARFLLPTLLFGAVLTARRLIEVTARVPAVALAAAGIALGAAYLSPPLEPLRRPVPVNPSVAVVDWLKARSLDRGYGQYWVAGLTTVSGRGTVAVRPVYELDGRLRADTGFADRRWFDDKKPFRFVVLDLVNSYGVDQEAAEYTFGPAAEAHDIGPYRVLVWNGNLTVPLAPS